MYDTIVTDVERVKTLMEAARPDRPNPHAGILETPFETEVYQAIRAGGKKKAPGDDGLGCEFYSHNWPIIRDMCEVLNQMFWTRNIKPKQKHGVIVCRNRVATTRQKTTTKHYSIRNITYSNE
jgi:hypothetical protein